MTPIYAFLEWLQLMPELQNFDAQVGLWQAVPGPVVNLMSVGGAPGTGPEVYLDDVRVLLIGSADTQNRWKLDLYEVAFAIRERLDDDYRACGIAQIRLMGGIIGPGETEEGRVWYEMNFRLTN